MPAVPVSPVYTTKEEISRLISQAGLNLRVSDLNGADLEAYWTELIEEATETVNQYCSWTYDRNDLAGSRWVRSRTTWIAVVLLCRRRGNPVPDSFLQRYDEILEELELVRLGLLLIPGLPLTSDLLPAMSNLRTDYRFYSRKIRVNPSISVGRTSGRQDLDWVWTYDWF